MIGRGPIAGVLAALLVALLPGPTRAATPVWESRVLANGVQVGSGEFLPGLRNRAGASGEVYLYETRVIAPNGQVSTAVDAVNDAVWTQRPYPTGFEGAPPLMLGTYTFEFLVEGQLVRREQRMVGITPFAPGCAGDEQISFNPANPVAGQPFTIVATSAAAPTNVGLTGPGAPQFLGSSPGGKGTTWTYRVTLTQPGQYSYSFTVDGALCTTATVTVGMNDAPPPDAFWQFDYPRVVRLSETSSIALGIHNRNGRAGQQTIMTVVVGVPGGAAYSTRVVIVADAWTTVRFPVNFPQAPPLQPGVYRVEWRTSAGTTLAADSIQVAS
ncbi:MAG: hypothetical protein KatS3mg060_2103 [Dehalococcoidia bacterium]|nr:MAG: hypothetical protein KatS3mg060_2103 [Dehalococcoidia bacterium]